MRKTANVAHVAPLTRALRKDAKPRTPRQLAVTIRRLNLTMADAKFELGLIVDEVQRGNLWRDWPGATFATFAAWAWDITGLADRTARLYAYNSLRLAAWTEKAAAMRTRAFRVGYSKLTLVLRLSKTAEDFVRWLTVVEAAGSIENLRLRAALKAANGDIDAFAVPELQAAATSPPKVPATPKRAKATEDGAEDWDALVRVLNDACQAAVRHKAADVRRCLADAMRIIA